MSKRHLFASREAGFHKVVCVEEVIFICRPSPAFDVEVIFLVFSLTPTYLAAGDAGCRNKAGSQKLTM